ncbi:hypothetical protein HPB47_011857 [Ixodes persulcatus]|uniref:Uncharacterized protein n=1 Tax=Ixodes persulcatus TaxID=34615 RepID=A0AC60NV69_IXOPE|nr:hypothetical protein HPB47_011857 [Ixodes persulcatus]
MGNELGADTQHRDAVTGMSNQEKHVVRDTWAPFKKDAQTSSVAIFVVLFLKHPAYQKLFVAFAADPTAELPQNPRAIAHALTVAYAISSIIDTAMKHTDGTIASEIPKRARALRDLGGHDGTSFMMDATTFYGVPDPNFDQPNDASTASASRTSECDEDEDVTEAPKKRKRVTKWVKKSFDPGNVVCTHAFTNNEAPYEPIEYFARYIPYSIFETLALFSNFLQATGTELGTTPQEMKLFCGVMMYMAVLKFLRIRMYWQQRTRIAVVADTISLNRFFKLRSAVHVTDANSRDSKSPDKFWKVRPLVDAVRKRCLELDAAEHSSIDEQMIPFTGKVPAKQVIKSKPNPEGVKVFVRCSHDGLAHDFEIYQGKGTGIDTSYAHLGLGA